MATAAPASEPADEPIPDRGDVHKVARQWALRHQGHEGVMLRGVMRTQRRAEKLEKFAATGDPKDLEFTPEEEADMGVNIGNEHHYHLVQSKEEPVDKPAPERSTPSPLMAAGLTAAALLGGGSLGAGALALGQMLAGPDEPRAPPEPPPAVVTDGGGHMQYELEPLPGR